MYQSNRFPNFLGLLSRRPEAFARVSGSAAYPAIRGNVRFYQTVYGVVAVAELMGLPKREGDCAGPIFAFHIHEGASCTGQGADPFSDVGMHYNPEECPHPYHTGDLPPLWGAEGGYAFSAFLTDRFRVADVIGRSVVIHASLDDFSTQPAGNAGSKIACGEITRA